MLPGRIQDDSVVGGARGPKDREAEENGEGEEKEKEEEETEESLKKARDWDEFKDG